MWTAPLPLPDETETDDANTSVYAEARGELDRLMFTSASATMDAKERLERMRGVARSLRR